MLRFIARPARVPLAITSDDSALALPAKYPLNHAIALATFVMRGGVRGPPFASPRLGLTRGEAAATQQQRDAV